jgi:hypothetical protein
MQGGPGDTNARPELLQKIVGGNLEEGVCDQEDHEGNAVSVISLWQAAVVGCNIRILV